jgi:hypothetical protein
MAICLRLFRFSGDAMATKPSVDENALRVMGALVRMPPKPHDEMKIGKSKGKRGKGRPAKGRRVASAKR